MPRKKPGVHNFHVEIKTDDWKLLQMYCLGGVERITATSIINNLVSYYIDECIRPRLELDDESQVANYAHVSADIQKTVKAVAHKIEPSAFPEA